MPSTRRKRIAPTTTTDDSSETATTTTPVTVTTDANGLTHLIAHGLHRDSVLALELMAEKLRLADVRADKVISDRRARRLRKSITLATASTPRLNLRLVAVHECGHNLTKAKER